MAKTAKKNSSGQTLNLTMRPRTFDDVIGLDKEVAAVKQLLTSDTVPRAFLLAGPFGCGKTTLAHLIAHAVQGPDCPADTRLFIKEVNAASITGIDAMRDLIDASHMRPLAGRYSIVILDEAHKLSKPAQEALLKELESETSPTIWIICTTDKEKLAEGIRAGRCFTLVVKGLDDAGQRQLVQRAAKAAGHEGDVSEFVSALIKARVTSPRKILMAFDAFHAGIPAGEAIGAMHLEALPEYWEICFGVCFGTWNAKYTLPWIDGKQFPAVCDQLRLLDDRLKRRASSDEGRTELDDDDVQGRPDVAQALRAITAATLKGQLARHATRFDRARAQKAAEALHVLAHCLGQNCFGLEYPLVLGALFRVNTIMVAGK
jgi:ATPase family associated with various cellular activities (AAA)